MEFAAVFPLDAGQSIVHPDVKLFTYHCFCLTLCCMVQIQPATNLPIMVSEKYVPWSWLQTVIHSYKGVSQGGQWQVQKPPKWSHIQVPFQKVFGKKENSLALWTIDHSQQHGWKRLLLGMKRAGWKLNSHLWRLGSTSPSSSSSPVCPSVLL